MKQEEDIIISLVKKAQNGDEEALKELFTLYSPLIKKIVSLYCFSGSKKEDFLEEAIFSFWKAIKNYRRESGSFSSFASLLINRNLIDLLKKKSFKVETVAFGTLQDIAVNNEFETKILEEIERELFFKKLSVFERDVLRLYIGGSKPSLIAKTLNVKKSKVFNALSRIKEKFKKIHSES